MTVPAVGPQVQRRERVDLPGMRNRLDDAEDAVGLLHAGAVVSLDAIQIQRDELRRRDLLAQQAAA